MAQVGYWFARSQSACGAQSSVKLGGGRFSDQPTALARTLPKYTPRADNTGCTGGDERRPLFP
eukprot:scaffold15592_cov62-Skeletonema_dohrnii-CCMP3373.AAC.1